MKVFRFHSEPIALGIVERDPFIDGRSDVFPRVDVERRQCILLGLDAVSFTDVQSVLAEVTGGKAKMTLSGAVNGAVGGVGTEIELKALKTANNFPTSLNP